MRIRSYRYRFRPRSPRLPSLTSLLRRLAAHADTFYEKPHGESPSVEKQPENGNGPVLNEALAGRPTSVLTTVDQFVAAVPWTLRRMVLVYLRHHGARTYVRLRTFNRHKKLGCWYPSPRYFVIPQECARDLAKAIEAAASGQRFGSEPDWYRDFEKQYATLAGSSASSGNSEPGRGVPVTESQLSAGS